MTKGVKKKCGIILDIVKMIQNPEKCIEIQNGKLVLNEYGLEQLQNLSEYFCYSIEYERCVQFLKQLKCFEDTDVYKKYLSHQIQWDHKIEESYFSKLTEEQLYNNIVIESYLIGHNYY